MSSHQDSTLEGAFYDYVHRAGHVDAAANRRVLEFYTPFFEARRRVLDIGCGEGQFIELLQEHGISAAGIDLDAQMVQGCTTRGLPVEQADLFNYLPGHSAEFDGVFCSNVIEHLAMPDALRLLKLAHDALLPGGVLLLATENPESLIVQLCEFWRDATHVRLYHRSLLEFLLSFTGFSQIQSGENPAAAWNLPENLSAIPDVLARLPSWKAVPPRVSSTAQPSAPDTRPLLQRTLSSWQRSLGHWLANTLLYDELAQLRQECLDKEHSLASLESTLESWRGNMQQIGLALHQSSSLFLTPSREIFALGIKPAAGEGSQ